MTNRQPFPFHRSSPRQRRWAAALLSAVAVLCLLTAGRAAAQEQPPDLPTYTAWVREALAAAQRNDHFGLEQAAARLAATTAVRARDGTSLPVDNAWLREAMAADEPDVALITTRLGALLDALTRPDSRAPDDAQARLERILNNPPFARSQSEPSQSSWLRDLLEWLARLLESLFRPVSDAAQAGSSLIGWAIAIIGGGLLAAVIGYLLLGLRRSVVREASIADDDPEANLTAKTALDQASVLARAGDYRAAVRYLYLAALLRLDERKLLRYDRALTNREYLEQVRDNEPLRRQLAPVVETFDRVWYGHAPLDAAGFAAYREQVEALGR